MLTKHSALAKDKRNAKNPVMEHRHYAVIAGIITGLSEEYRLEVALHFAAKLASTNPNFKRERFLTACGF
jgi:hypothetical protein